MARGADAGRAEVELAGLRLGQRDKLLQRLGLDLRIDDDQHRHVGDVGDGNERGLDVERHLRIEELIGREDAGRRHQQRVAVGRSLGDRIGADIAARARAVLDDDRLAERLRHLVADRARQHVGEAAGGERRDQLDRTVGIILRLRRGGEQRAHRLRTGSGKGDSRRSSRCSGWAHDRPHRLQVNAATWRCRHRLSSRGPSARAFAPAA